MGAEGVEWSAPGTEGAARRSHDGERSARHGAGPLDRGCGAGGGPFGRHIPADRKGAAAHAAAPGTPRRDRKSTRLNSSHSCATRMPSPARKNKTIIDIEPNSVSPLLQHPE